MTRDEEVYSDPESFKPERFINNGTLNKNIRDPRDIVFGFGRRYVLFRLTVSSFKTNHTFTPTP
jgi:cytochrome P450